MSGVTFYFVCYRGDLVCSTSESDMLCGQAECGGNDNVFFVLLVVHLGCVYCYSCESRRPR